MDVFTYEDASFDIKNFVSHRRHIVVQRSLNPHFGSGDIHSYCMCMSRIMEIRNLGIRIWYDGNTSISGLVKTWRYLMKTFSALLALFAWNSPVTGEFPSQRPVVLSFGVFFDLRLSKRVSKHSWHRWFETSLLSLWRHCNEKCTTRFTLGQNLSPNRSYKYIVYLWYVLSEIVFWYRLDTTALRNNILKVDGAVSGSYVTLHRTNK